MFLAGAKIHHRIGAHLVAQRIFLDFFSIDDATALLPMLALIFTRKLRPDNHRLDSG